MKSLEESIMTLFEVLLLVSIILFAERLSGTSVDDLSYLQGLIPPGACVEVYSSRPLIFNGTIHGTTLLLCRNSTGALVVSP